MRIAVAREADAAEDRVAATPETVKKMKALGADIAVEPGAMNAHILEYSINKWSFYQ
jgi:NAD/NADP transhydrogenase alpha subunit